jgi:hypothetical protein
LEVFHAIGHSALPWKHYPLGRDDFFWGVRNQDISIRRYMMKGLKYRTQVAHSVINDRNCLRQLLTYFL